MNTRTDCGHERSLLVIAAAAATILVAPSASAATVTVGPGAPACPGASYATIQAAVDAAAPGDEIRVCPGTYAEQITIPAGKDGLAIRSRHPLAATIKAPATMADPGDIVRVRASREITLEGFTIAGPLPSALFCSVFPRSAVRVDGGGSATIRRNRITDIRSEDPALRGCQSGIPILVGSEPEQEIGSALVEENTIEAYQKTGVLVEHAGSSAIVRDNRILGDGPNDLIAQNGIEVSSGAEALVAGNWVAGQIYAPTPLASGLLFIRPGRVIVIGNEIRDADHGIITIDATGPEIRSNRVAACTASGIDLDESEAGTTGAIVVANESRDNGADGIYISPKSTGNALRHNRMFADRDVDARDDSTGHGTAGTANRWRDDRCRTDNRGGLLCEER